MPSLLPICFVTNRGQLAYGPGNATTLELPPLYQEDGVPIEFSAVKRLYETSPIFESIPLTGYALKISIGSAGNILATQETWSLNSAGTTLSGTLDLNTAGIAALGSPAQTVTFEIRLSGSSGFFRGQFPVTIWKSVALVSSLNPVVTDTALGRLEAARTYMRKQGAPGEGFILVSADGNKQCFEYLHNDGSRQSTPLT